MRVRSSATATAEGGRQEAVEGSGENVRGAADGPALGNRVNYRCPFCDSHKANATYKPNRDGFPEWFIGCWTHGCDGRHLPSLAEALDLDPGTDKEEIVAALRRCGTRGRRAESESLPSLASVEGWHARLLGPDGREARAYLAGRGVSRRGLGIERVGFDGKRLTFPMFDAAGELVAFKRRLPEDGAQMKAPKGSGRPWPLYPAVDRRHSWVLLVAGELDALAARSAGLPAGSVTLGAGYLGERWDGWTAELAGLRVVVAFDNNEGEQARAAVSRLRAAGINAQRLDLRDLGLMTPKGDVSDYLAGGGDPARLARPRRRVRRTA